MEYLQVSPRVQGVRVCPVNEMIIINLILNTFSLCFQLLHILNFCEVWKMINGKRNKYIHLFLFFQDVIRHSKKIQRFIIIISIFNNFYLVFCVLFDVLRIYGNLLSTMMLIFTFILNA